MFFMIIALGFIFGLIVYMFMYIASKRSGKYFIAPFVTFIVAVLLTMYGLFVVGGFEGMAYGLLGLGFLIVAIIGTLLLPVMLRNGVEGKEFSNKDKVGLFLLPFLLFSVIFSLVYFDKGYWVIDEGTRPYSESTKTGYRLSTISEGKKAVYIRLGKDHVGKSIEVKKVSQMGQTTVIIDIQDNGEKQREPYIRIGLDRMKDELTVKTTDGEIIESLDKY